MVVVVQFFAADDQAPWQDIGAGIGRLEIAIAPVVADTVDHAGRGDRDPGHLHRPHGQARQAEQGDVQDQHQANALPAVTGVEIALDPVIRRAVAELDHRFRVLGFGTVELGTAPQHGFDTARLRAVRVVRGLALGVVLAVDGDPFLGHHAGTQPEPEAEKVRWDPVQVHRAMRLRTVQENGDAGDGDMGRHQRVQNDLPPGQVPQAIGKPVNGRVQNGPIGKQHRWGISL